MCAAANRCENPAVTVGRHKSSVRSDVGGSGKVSSPQAVLQTTGTMVLLLHVSGRCVIVIGMLSSLCILLRSMLAVKC